MKSYYLQLEQAVNGKYVDFLNKLGDRESNIDEYQCVNYAKYIGKYQIGEDTIPGEYYKKTDSTSKANNWKWNGNWKGLSGINSLFDLMGVKNNTPVFEDRCKVPNPYKKKHIVNKEYIDDKKIKNAILVQEDIIRIVHLQKWESIINLMTTHEETVKLKKMINQSEIKEFLVKKLRIGEKFKYKGQEYKITTSGIIAGAHLVGEGGLKKYLKDKSIKQDGLGTSVLEYMAKFGGYDMTELFNYVPFSKRGIVTPGGKKESNAGNSGKSSGSVSSKGSSGKGSSGESSTGKYLQVQKSASGKITVRNFKKADFMIMVPEYKGKNGAKSIDDKPKPVKSEDKSVDLGGFEGKAVCCGATLKCDKGSVISKLVTVSNVTINSMPIAKISDMKPGTNILPFGTCAKKNNPPCTPVISGNWSNGITHFIATEAVVSTKSTLSCCAAGGKIEIVQEGQTGVGHQKIGSVGSTKKEEKAEEKKEEQQQITVAKKIKATADQSIKPSLKAKIKEIQFQITRENYVIINPKIDKKSVVLLGLLKDNVGKILGMAACHSIVSDEKLKDRVACSKSIVGDGKYFSVKIGESFIFGKSPLDRYQMVGGEKLEEFYKNKEMILIAGKIKAENIRTGMLENLRSNNNTKTILKVEKEEDAIRQISKAIQNEKAEMIYFKFSTGGNNQGDFLDWPDSYRPKLRELKSKHPKWIFEKLKVNTTLEKYVDKQYGKYCLVDIISQQEPTSIVYDSPNWKKAKKEVVESAINPLNNLDEKNIFQYLVLDCYSEDSQTKEGLKAIIPRTKNRENKLKFEGYEEYFIEGAKLNKINAYFLASKWRTETGNESTTMSKGNLYRPSPNEEARKVYNVFGIAAYDGNGAAKINNQSKFAYRNGWFSKREAIIGGGKFVRGQYIDKGQTTMSLIRYNMLEGKYKENQYGTNVNMALTEAGHYYKAYLAANKLESELKFIIPVFKEGE